MKKSFVIKISLILLLCTLFVIACRLDNYLSDDVHSGTGDAGEGGSRTPIKNQLSHMYTNYYKIVERENGRILWVDNYKNSDKYEIYGSYGECGLNQQFIVIPVTPDGSRIFLAGRQLGGVVDIASTSLIYLYDGYPHGGLNQQFELQATDSGYFRIYSPNPYGAFELTRPVFLFGNTLYNKIYNGEGIQQFKFEPADSLPYPVSRQTGYTPYQIGNPPCATGIGFNPPKQTTEKLINEAIIPYIYIRNDGSRTYQTNTTPYYKLTWMQYWENDYHRVKPMGESYKSTWKITYGVERSSAYSIEQMTSIKFTTKSEFVFGIDALKATLGTTIESQTSIKTIYSSSIKTSETEEYTGERILPTDKGCSFTVWNLIDLFILKRMDGTEVTRWTIKHEDYEFVDLFLC
ncbi:MAG: hypothetical protein JXB88_11340 [Spirochaetales bacterium]|nr:hypothetical protein [Spirochaetales bacterium]